MKKGFKSTNKSFKSKIDISTNFKFNKETEKRKIFDSYFNFFKSTFNSLKFYDIDRVKNFEDIPQKNNIAVIMTRKNINSFEILQHINNRHKIENLHVSFNVINEVGYRELSKYNVESITSSKKFNCSETIKKFKNIYPDFSNKVNELYQHTKLILAKCEDDNYIVVNSTANPSLSSRNESYIIFNDKIIYDNLIDFFEKRENKNLTKNLLPENDEIFNFISQKDKTTFDVIKQINPTEIDKIYLIQYSEAFKDMQIFKDYCEKYNIPTFAFFSKRIFDMKPFIREKINILFPNYFAGDTTHCKMFLVLCKNNHYIFSSTANFFSSNKFEVTTIFNNKYLFENIVKFANDFFKD